MDMDMVVISTRQHHAPSTPVQLLVTAIITWASNGWKRNLSYACSV